MRPKFARRDSGEPSDGDLVRQFQSGREAAFVQLMTRHERRVYNLAYRMLGRTEDARDATQEAFLSCFRHLESFRGDSAFATWLHRIAVNACYDILRRRPPVTSSLEDRPEAAAAPDHAEQAAGAADIQRALLAVAPEFRAVLILHEVQDIPVEDIAAALDIPVGTVKSRLHRGRVALGRALGGDPRGGRVAASEVGPADGHRLVSPLEPRPAAAPSNPPIP
jgi:RNA polymerase sigma-70 factor (ECF subfamily)